MALSTNCWKYLVLTFNVLFAMSAVVLFGASGFLLYRLFIYRHFLGVSVEWPAILLLMMAIITCSIAWIGWRTAQSLHQIHVIITGILIVFVVVVEFSCFVWAMVVWDNIEIDIKTTMTAYFATTVHNIEPNGADAIRWDRLHVKHSCSPSKAPSCGGDVWRVVLFPNRWLRRTMAGTCVILVIGCCLWDAGLLSVYTQFECCGVGGPNDFASTGHVPFSCCGQGPLDDLHKPYAADCSAVYQRGCGKPLHDYATDQLLLIAMTALAASVLQSTGIFCTFFLAHSIKERRRASIRNSSSVREATFAAPDDSLLTSPTAPAPTLPKY